MTTHHRDLEEPLLPSSVRGGSTESVPHEDEEDHDGPAPAASASSSAASSQSRSSSSSSSSFSSPASPVCRRNVNLCLLYTFFAFAGRSVWSQSVLATFVYLFTHSSPKVGYSAAVLGAVQLAVSIPSGCFADRGKGGGRGGGGGAGGGRSRSLRFASLVGLAAVTLTLHACWYRRSRPSYELLLGALAAWGAYWGIANTALMALFADSVPSGMARSRYFTLRSTATLAGNTVGPLVSLLMFARLGDRWTLSECAAVIALGQVLFLPSLLLAYRFEDVTPAATAPGDGASPSVSASESDDDDDRGEQEESSQLGRPLLVQIDEALSDNPRRREIDDTAEAERIFDGMSVVETSYRGRDGVGLGLSRHRRRRDDDDDDSSSGGGSKSWCCCLRLRDRPGMVPYLIASGDVLSGLGAGMSIQHLPLFLMQQLELRPVQVQAVAAVTPLVVAGLMHLAQGLASSSSAWRGRRLGRCRVALAFKWVGAVLMALMVASREPWRAPRLVTCLLYVVRSGFMNSTGALTRSVLMDHVPPCRRGRWAAVESVNMFSWSGSAALGGLVIARLGSPLPLFGITALVQFLASLFLIPLLDLDDDDESSGTTDHEDDDGDCREGLETDTTGAGGEPRRQTPRAGAASAAARWQKRALTLQTSASSSSLLSSSTAGSSPQPSSSGQGREGPGVPVGDGDGGDGDER